MHSHMRTTLIELTTIHRLGYLALSDWDPQFKRDLLRQPGSSPALFNCHVSKTHVRVSAFARDETALGALARVSQSASLKPSQSSSY